MRTKRVISSLLLAIYLMASCGAMLSVILCHCTRSQHFQTHHCCSHNTCHNNHINCGEGIKLPNNCGCTHDHSTEIDLYIYEKSFIADIQPVICDAIPAMAEQIDLCTELLKIKYLDKSKIPLPQSGFISTKGLRAPPVIA